MRRSSLRFCLVLAALAVLGRLTAFDWREYFGLHAVPNHDMYQGAAFFATSMHSVALFGDLAWWNPIANNGYAQYYQAFLSPLAPTPHSIVYIVWAQAVRAASVFGLRMPEYFQYLTINYLVLPFAAFFAVGWLASLLVRRRAAVALFVIVYAFSSIGLWNGAWFYFQEPATLFFLLAASIAALRSPSVPRLLLLLLAVVNQVTSLNYWTLYNAWFFLIVVGSFLIVHRRPLVRLRARFGRAFRARRSAAQVPWASLSTALVLALASLLTWGVIIGSVVAEQGGAYVRSGVPEGAYRVDDAYQLIRPIRYYTLELFNPEIERPIRHYPVFEFPNPIHNGRYLGAVLLPLLLVLPFYRWRRREQWLALATLGTLVVWLAPPALLLAWEATPFMTGIQHLFYFYSHHWQTLVVLLSAVAFDRMLGTTEAAVGQRLLLVAGISMAGIALVLAVFWLLSSVLPPDSLLLRAVVRVALLVLIPCVLLMQRLLHDTSRARRLLAGVVLLLASADLTKYFYDVSVADREFTASFRFVALWKDKVAYPLPGDLRNQLAAAWAAPNASAGFSGDVYRNMPIPSSFWPENAYVIHRALRPLDDPARQALRDAAVHGPPIEFVCAAEAKPLPSDGPPAPAGESRQSRGMLWFTGAEAGAPDTARPQPGSERRCTPTPTFTAVMREWSYNAFTFDLEAPDDGFVLIRQLPDARWRLTLDGRPVRGLEANFAALAVPLTAGRHRLHMNYQPMARRLYWPAGFLLQATWVATLAIAARARRA